MSEGLNILDTVALLRDVRDAGLVKGQVGTIVEVLGGGQFLIEFSGDDGQAFAIVPVQQTELLRLQFAADAAE